MWARHQSRLVPHQRTSWSFPSTRSLHRSPVAAQSTPRLWQPSQAVLHRMQEPPNHYENPDLDNAEAVLLSKHNPLLFPHHVEGSHSTQNQLKSILQPGNEARLHSGKEHVGISSTHGTPNQEVDSIYDLLVTCRWDGIIVHSLNSLPFRINANHVFEILRRPLHAKVALCFFLWARQLDSYKCDNRTYNSVVNVAVRARHFQAIDRVLQHLREDGCILNTITCNTLIQGYGIAHKVEEAFSVFHNMDGILYAKPNIRTCNLLLHMLVKENDLERVPGFYEEILYAGYCPDIFTCNIYMLYLCKCQKFDEGHNWLDIMPCPPNVVTYSTLIDGLCKAGRMLQANLVLGQMLEEDISPDVHLFTCLMDGFCKVGSLGEAWKLFHYMEAKDVKPNVVTYTAIVDKMLKAGLTDGALSILNLMQTRDCAPNVFLCTARIDSLCKHQQLETAYNVLRQMNEAGCFPNTVTYCALIDGFVKAGNAPGAMALLNEMSSKGCTPNAHLYASLIYGFAMEGEDAKAKLILEESLSKDRVPDTRVLNSWMTGLYRSQRVDEAYQLFLNLRSEGFIPSTVTFNILITGFAKSNRMGLARVMFDSIFKHKCQPDLCSYTNLVKGYCNLSDVSNALKWLLDSVRRGFVHVFRFHVYTVLKLFRRQTIDYAKSLLRTLNSNCIYSSPADKRLFYRLLKARSYSAARRAIVNWRKVRGD